MKRLTLTFMFFLVLSMPLFAADGMINVPSHHPVAETADRLEQILRDKGMTVFARVRHSAAAHEVGIELRDTELLIFGNPKVGSPFMQCQQSVAIDLPQKALLWQDEQGKVWISYNDPQYIAQRHQARGCDAVIGKIGKALAGITAAAAR